MFRAMVLGLVLCLGLPGCSGVLSHGIVGELVKEKETEDRVMIFEIYSGVSGEWFWRLKAANGQVVATSGEGYKAKAHAVKMVDIIKAETKKAKVKILEDNGK